MSVGYSVGAIVMNFRTSASVIYSVKVTWVTKKLSSHSHVTALIVWQVISLALTLYRLDVSLWSEHCNSKRLLTLTCV